MKKKRGFGRWLILASIFVACFPASAQVERASITGTVADASGAAIPGVMIQVTNDATNTSTNVTSDSGGAYIVVNLIPGKYTVTASHSGFQKQVFRNYELQVSQQARLEMVMSVGAVEQTIEVQAAAPLLQTENASVGQVIASEAVNSLPLNGRNFVQLAIIAPGVTGLDYAQPATINSGRRPDELRPGGTTLQANGARNTSNQVLLDGIDNSEMISQTFIVRPAVEGIQEFKVLTNNAGAEYGRAGGAVVVITSKSGGNAFHGSAFEFFRNSNLDAANFFANRSLPKPPFRLNQFGGSLGGPIVRNKAFFFGNYEAYREIFGDTQLVSVPTAPMREGDFRGVAANGIYDPLTTRANPTGSGTIRDRFPNDLIPQNRWDPIGRQLINLYPLPQTSSLFNNYVANPKKFSKMHRADGRIDYQHSSRDTFFGRYSIDRGDLEIPDTFDKNIGGSPASFAGVNDVKGQNLVGAWTHILSPSKLIDLRYGYTQYNMALLPTQLTNPLWNTIPGRNTQDPFQPSAPIIEPNDRAGLGNARSVPLIRDQKMHEFIGNMNWLRSAHSIKFGVDIRFRDTGETASPPGENAFGRWNFGPDFSRNPASTAGTGDTMATMLLGFPTVVRRDVFTAGTATLNTTESNFYVRDEWRVRNNLTLNLGLHYEINTPFTEKNDIWANFDPVTAKQLIAGKDGVSRTGGIETDYTAWGPRVGFAWTPERRTVIRGGFGIFYEPQGNFNTNIRQFRQPPFGFQVNVPINVNVVPTSRLTDGFPPVTVTPNLLQGPPIYTLRGVTPDFKNGRLMQFNFSVQRELRSDMVVTLGYVGSLGRHLTWSRPLNQPDPGPGDLNARRPFINQLPGVSGISWLETSGASAYSSMQLAFEKRFSKGFYMLANWTWAHGLDNSGGDGGANGPIPQDPRNRNADWSSSNSDMRHRVNIAASYQLPFRIQSPLRHLLGGWETAGIIVYQTGLPFTVTATGSPTNTGAGGRANVVPGVDPYPEEKTITRWFNPAAFSIPTAFNWGNAGRNTLRGPSVVNFDLTASKKFALGEGRELNFRTEFFNAFNHPQFGLPVSSVGAGNIGAITSTLRSNRQLQLALRLTF